MRRAVGLNHVAEREHLRAPPVGLCVAPRHPSRCRALPVGTWCAARRPESHRAGRSEVTSPPCAVWWVSPALPTPWLPPATALYDCRQYTLSSITGRESSTPETLFCTICPDSSVRAVQHRCAPSARSFRPATLPARPVSAQLPRLRWPPPALEPPRGRVRPCRERVMRGRSRCRGRFRQARLT